MIIAGKISIHPQKEQKLDSIFNPNLLNKNCNSILDFYYEIKIALRLIFWDIFEEGLQVIAWKTTQLTNFYFLGLIYEAH